MSGEATRCWIEVRYRFAIDRNVATLSCMRIPTASVFRTPVQMAYGLKYLIATVMPKASISHGSLLSDVSLVLHQRNRSGGVSPCVKRIMWHQIYVC